MDRVNVTAIVVVLTAAIAVNLWAMYRPEIDGEAPAPPPQERFAIAPSTPVEPLKPIGPEDAPVTVAVFYQANNPCHDYIEPGARDLAERYSPRIRVELLPWFAEGTRERAEELTVECLISVTVTGPPPVEEDAQPPEPIRFTSPNEVGAWTWDDVAEVVETRLVMAGVDPEPRAVADGKECTDADRSKTACDECPCEESTHG
ncbi:MAG: hypothetical protein GF393_02025 [Armatimonadia bacterium]|nr:hypothetical protein [Armatimonadia bacterium]